MKQITLFAFLCFSTIALTQKEVELKVTVTNQARDLLSGITVEYRDPKNNLLFSEKTNEQGHSSYSAGASQTVLVMVYDDQLTYAPINDYYTKKNGSTTFIFALDDIATKIEGYKKLDIKLANDSTVLDLLTGCGTSTEPEFQGGQQGFLKFLQQNLRYPEFALDFGIGGRSYARFLIDENGNITNIRISKGFDGCKECDIEVMRVLSLMPPMIPATCDGKKVPMYYNLPIKFTPG